MSSPSSDAAAPATLPDPVGPILKPGDAVPSHFRGCFGCGPDHPTGLHMQGFVETETSVTCVVEIRESEQGARGLAHGGMLSTIMDESLGFLLWLVGSPAVTGSLQVNYRKPVPVGSLLHVRSELLGVEGRRVNARAEGRINAPDGVLAVEGAAVFVRVGLEHFRNSRDEAQS